MPRKKTAATKTVTRTRKAKAVSPVATPAPIPVVTQTPKKTGFIGSLFRGNPQPNRGFLYNMFNGKPKQQKPSVVAHVATPVAPVAPSGKVIAKSISSRNWKLFGGGIACILVGVIAFIPYLGNPRGAQMLGFVGVLCLAAGGIMLYFGMKTRESGMVLLTPDGKRTKNIKANSLNIYDKGESVARMAFEQLPDEVISELDTSAGILPRKCRNDGKYYYIHISATAFKTKEEMGKYDRNKLVSFELPDTKYRDPVVFALNLNIPARRKLANRIKQTLGQKIAVWALVAACGIVALLLIAVPSTSTASNSTAQHPATAQQGVK